METHDRQDDRQRKEPGTAEQCPEEQLPIMDAFCSADAEPVNRSAERQDILRFQMDLDFRRLIFLEKCTNPFRIMRGFISVSYETAIIFPQQFESHFGDDIGRIVRVIAGYFFCQAVFR